MIITVLLTYHKILFHEIDSVSQTVFAPDGCGCGAAVFFYQRVFGCINGLEKIFR